APLPGRPRPPRSSDAARPRALLHPQDLDVVWQVDDAGHRLAAAHHEGGGVVAVVDQAALLVAVAHLGRDEVVAAREHPVEAHLDGRGLAAVGAAAAGELAAGVEVEKHALALLGAAEPGQRVT